MASNPFVTLLLGFPGSCCPPVRQRPKGEGAAISHNLCFSYLLCFALAGKSVSPATHKKKTGVGGVEFNYYLKITINSNKCILVGFFTRQAKRM
jgi:hypothetical protein